MMENMLLRLTVQYSTSHMFFPKIVIGILIVLGIIILLMNIVSRVKSKKPLLDQDRRFFVKGYDKLKFFGSIALFILYIYCLKPLGFLYASILFIFLFNVLFCGTLRKKSLVISAAVSVISSVTVWYLFGIVFRITLP